MQTSRARSAPGWSRPRQPTTTRKKMSLKEGTAIPRARSSSTCKRSKFGSASEEHLLGLGEGGERFVGRFLERCGEAVRVSERPLSPRAAALDKLDGVRAGGELTPGHERILDAEPALRPSAGLGREEASPVRGRRLRVEVHSSELVQEREQERVERRRRRRLVSSSVGRRRPPAEVRSHEACHRVRPKTTRHYFGKPPSSA
mmetsp:Transcript_19666/g.63909  ORF Transcript_19666/g.63909 Transcript_19666/m.63909 type:complete len:202 (-) Transcript_19666:29-634(-)